MLTEGEKLAFIPITILSFIYFFRDILRFNRLKIKSCTNIRLTIPQIKVGLLCYPIWIFLTWTENIAQKRNDFFVVVVMNIVGTYVGWWTTIAIFNDGFMSSRQQKASLILSFLLSATWRITNILIFN